MKHPSSAAALKLANKVSAPIAKGGSGGHPSAYQSRCSRPLLSSRATMQIGRGWLPSGLGTSFPRSCRSQPLNSKSQTTTSRKPAPVRLSGRPLLIGAEAGGGGASRAGVVVTEYPAGDG